MKRTFKHLLALSLLLCSVFIFSSCNETDNKVPLGFREGITLNMSYNDVMELEKKNGVSFSQDYSQSTVNDEHVIKAYISDDIVKYEDTDATLMYWFSDDKLIIGGYLIKISYPTSERFETPTYKKYMELVLKYTDEKGKPTITEEDKDSEYTNYYVSAWNTIDSSYTITCSQTVDYIVHSDEIEDYIAVQCSIPTETLNKIYKK